MKRIKYILFSGIFWVALGLVWPGTIMAQNQQSTAAGPTQQDLTMFLLTTAVIMAVVCLILALSVYWFLKARTFEAAAKAGVDPASQELAPVFSWRNITKRLTRAVPVKEEKSIDMGHDYDGIRELDNALPPWWKWGFYITIGISVIYFWYYEVSSDWSSKQEYEIAMEEARVQKEAFLAQVSDQVDETSVEILADAASLESGKTIYETSCIACHLARGEGSIGPNLTDAYWLHGGSVQDVFSTIKYGVPEKGMIAWQDQLRPRQIQEVTSYILSFEPVNPPEGKDPQGELYVPQEIPETDSLNMEPDTLNTLTLR